MIVQKHMVGKVAEYRWMSNVQPIQSHPQNSQQTNISSLSSLVNAVQTWCIAPASFNLNRSGLSAAIARNPHVV